MACLRASFASLCVLRSSASMRGLVADSVASTALQAGQRLAKPGLSGFSSNSSEQTVQTLMGKAMQLYDNRADPSPPGFPCTSLGLRASKGSLDDSAVPISGRYCSLSATKGSIRAARRAGI